MTGQKNSLSGLLLVDKPAGVTSFEGVRRVRQVLRVRKAGHLGTLDPFATGLLPICLGDATKLTPYLLGADKTYLARLKLGEETDTLDVTGKVVARCDRLPGEAEISQVAAALQGEMLQTPPMYSAVHHQGERLYQLARRGQKVEVPPRRVVIHHMAVEEIELPYVNLRVTCSKGTYIRVLAADLGKALGCGAHLVGLRRLAVGTFQVDTALPLAVLEEPSKLEEVLARIIPMSRCLPEIKAVRLQAAELRRLQQGQAVPCPLPGFLSGEPVKVVHNNDLYAMAEVRQHHHETWLAPLRVFART